MKWIFLLVLVLDLVLIVGAAIRFATSDSSTPPLVDVMALVGGGTAEDDTATTTRGEGHDARQDFVSHMREVNRVNEIAETGQIATGAVGGAGSTEYNVDRAIDRASSIEENRQEDLDSAKQAIGQIGK